jgi:hypothetical protein
MLDSTSTNADLEWILWMPIFIPNNRSNRFRSSKMQHSEMLLSGEIKNLKSHSHKMLHNDFSQYYCHYNITDLQQTKSQQRRNCGKSNHRKSPTHLGMQFSELLSGIELLYLNPIM